MFFGALRNNSITFRAMKITCLQYGFIRTQMQFRRKNQRQSTHLANRDFSHRYDFFSIGTERVHHVIVYPIIENQKKKKKGGIASYREGLHTV